MKPVFEYTDYRNYLSDYFDEQKREKSFFSYRYFSNKIGFKSKDFIYRVIHGKKNFSKSSIMQVSTALGHGKREAEYFENLVWFTQAKKHNERELYYQQMTSAAKRGRVRSAPFRITREQYALFSEWYHLTVRSLIDLYGFKGDYAWLAKKIYPPITEAQAKKSVALLENLGLIIKNEEGVYRTREKAVTTGEEIEQQALHTFYLSCLQHAGEALDAFPRDKRNISGLTLGISEKSYAAIVRRIQEFRRELAEIAQNDAEADRVYQVNFLAFPVSDVNSTERSRQ